MKTTILKAGTIKRIHVRRDLVGKLAQGKNVAVICVQTSKGPHYGKEVSFGAGAVLTQKRRKLSCGARVYVETTGEVIIHA